MHIDKGFMNTALKKHIKEKLGIIVGISTLVFAIIGIFSLSGYITIYGSILICIFLFGMYKYA